MNVQSMSGLVGLLKVVTAAMIKMAFLDDGVPQPGTQKTTSVFRTCT